MWLWLLIQLASASGGPAATADVIVQIRADDVVVQVRADDVVVQVQPDEATVTP